MGWAAKILCHCYKENYKEKIAISLYMPWFKNICSSLKVYVANMWYILCGVAEMCDMCSSPDAVYRIELEGIMLNVCEKCASYGRIVARLKKEEPAKKKTKKSMFFETEIKPQKKTETVQLITPKYPRLIKNARENLDLKQKELAKKIAEKESVIHKLESGRMKPGIPLARKLEKFLKIKLVEEVELDDSGISPGKGEDSEKGLTLGDLIDIK